MDKKFRVFKLRNRTEEELTRDLKGLKEELSSLRVSKQAGGTASKLGKIRTLRKAIAKYLTVINQKGRDRVRESYKKSKYLPLDMRAKKTRALRRQLTRQNLRQKTVRQWKQVQNFPLRQFALKA